MKKRIYIAPAQTVVEMDVEDAMMQVLTTSIEQSNSSEDDVTERAGILSTGDEGFGWSSSLWDEDE